VLSHDVKDCTSSYVPRHYHTILVYADGDVAVEGGKLVRTAVVFGREDVDHPAIGK